MTTQPFGCNSIQYLANFADIPWKTDFGISLISTFSIIFNFFIGLFFVSCYFFTFYKKKGNIDLLFFVAICMFYIRFVPIRDLVVFFFWLAHRLIVHIRKCLRASKNFTAMNWIQMKSFQFRSTRFVCVTSHNQKKKQKRNIIFNFLFPIIDYYSLIMVYWWIIIQKIDVCCCCC